MPRNRTSALDQSEDGYSHVCCRNAGAAIYRHISDSRLSRKFFLFVPVTESLQG